MEKKQKIPTEQEIREVLELRHTKTVQEKLGRARVAVCGLGGLGSAISIALARCGVGHLHLIDFDCVDLSNVNRQQYALSQIGMPKPEAMAEEIRRFSPYIEIRTSHVKMTPDNAKELLSDADYICEAFDAPEEKAMLTGLVREVIFKGVHFEMHVDVEGYEWLIHSTQASQPGELIGMNIGPDEIHIMARTEV